MTDNIKTLRRRITNLSPSSFTLVDLHQLAQQMRVLIEVFLVTRQQARALSMPLYNIQLTSLCINNFIFQREHDKMKFKKVDIITTPPCQGVKLTIQNILKHGSSKHGLHKLEGKSILSCRHNHRQRHRSPSRSHFNIPKHKRPSRVEDRSLARQIRNPSLRQNVLKTHLPKDFITTKINLDNYDNLTDPRNHVQNIRNSIELVIQDTNAM